VAELRVRAPAQSDLGEIESYSNDRFGEKIGEAYMRGLARAFEQIAEYPRSAPLRPDYGAKMRCKPFRSHRILYQVAKDHVEILRVLHISRDVRADLR